MQAAMQHRVVDSRIGPSPEHPIGFPVQAKIEFAPDASSLQKIRLSSDWANPFERESELAGGW